MNENHLEGLEGTTLVFSMNKEIKNHSDWFGEFQPNNNHDNHEKEKV